MVLTDTVAAMSTWISSTLDVVVSPATFQVRLDNGATVSMTQGTQARVSSGLPTGGHIDLQFGSDVAAGSATLATVDNALQFQVGGFAGQHVRISITDMSPDQLGVGVANLSDFDNLGEIDVTTAGKASDSIGIIDQAISDVSTVRAELGSFQSNVLESNTNYMRIALENLTAAQSVVEDTDFAMEMSKFTRDQILLQSGTAMLSQANLIPQSVLQLIG
jgi:flagellin